MIGHVSGKLLLFGFSLVILLLAFVVFPFFDSKSCLDVVVIPVSSAWCSGSKTSEKNCFFKNLCYSPHYKEFVFHHDQNSILTGIPDDRFDPALAELSSVENHNTQYFHYVDLPWETVNLSDIAFIDSPTLLFNRFHTENIMHVFHDDLLPLYATLSTICKNKYEKEHCQTSVLFTDGNPWGPFEDLYKGLFERVSLIQDLSNKKLYCFKEVYVGVNKETVWYQYGFKAPQGPTSTKNTRASTYIRHFVKYFSSVLLSDTAINYDRDYAVVLIRKSNRRILNIKAVCAVISDMTKLEVKVLSLENYSITEIVLHIRQASMLVAMHGSILILSLFLKPKSIVIELFPYAVNPLHYTPYKSLTQLPGMNIIYEPWRNTISENTFIKPNNPPETGGIAHLTKEEQDAILNSDEVPLHLCCNNPEWLFRIYQDTLIDLPSFQRVLQKSLDQNRTQDFSDQSQLYPTRVSNPACQIDMKHNTMNVSWQEPWNIKFLKITNIEYELWIQVYPGNDSDVKAYILAKTLHTFTDIESNVDYLMWVRCIANKKAGPYINAVKCIKT